MATIRMNFNVCIIVYITSDITANYRPFFKHKYFFPRLGKDTCNRASPNSCSGNDCIYHK